MAAQTYKPTFELIFVDETSYHSALAFLELLAILRFLSCRLPPIPVEINPKILLAYIFTYNLLLHSRKHALIPSSYVNTELVC